MPLNFNWIDYTIPTMADMPDIDPVLLEVWRGGGEYGACGIGEGTLTCTPAGHPERHLQRHRGPRSTSIPLKPEKVLVALGKGEVSHDHAARFDHASRLVIGRGQRAGLRRRARPPPWSPAAPTCWGP